jgi:glutamyl-tRNA synthetase
LTCKTRIAPTPSGYLHLGNAFNFLLAEFIARRAGGHLRLRIDDLDAPRIRPEYLSDIFESLAWLGIQPDAGPADVADHEAHFSQSLRLPQYDTMLQRLVETGLVFACTCSRKQMLEASPDGQYAGACIAKHIPLDTPGVAWRIQTPPDTVIRFSDALAGEQHISLWEQQRHFIIRRRDGLPAYQVASLSDDITYGINTIVRGADLLSSTAAQLYLAGLLGMDGFINACFYHHPLLSDELGQKLSKSAGSRSLKTLREAGIAGQEIREAARQWYVPLLERGRSA